MFDGQQLGEDITALVRSFMEREIAPLKAENAEMKERLAAIEARPAPEVPEIDLMPVKELIDAEIAKLPTPEPAKEIDREELAEAITLAVGEAVAALPPPEKGEDGKSIDPAAVEEMVASKVAKAVAELPVPKDGQDGKDAAGIVEALKDSGELVFTLADGRLIRTGIRDGEKGTDGRDGFEIDDYDEWFEDDGRILVRQFVRGEDCKEFRHQTAFPIDRGVFKAGETYQQGDAVSWGGSLWIAQKETSAKPDTADSGWRLACKKGRDGKDAKNG